MRATKINQSSITNEKDSLNESLQKNPDEESETGGHPLCLMLNNRKLFQPTDTAYSLQADSNPIFGSGSEILVKIPQPQQ